MKRGEQTSRTARLLHWLDVRANKAAKDEYLVASRYMVGNHRSCQVCSTTTDKLRLVRQPLVLLSRALDESQIPSACS